ncbi:MAG: hypothetical protein JXB45_06995 [Candidatus Krumholzibacteriota bacterium]|nr:hypothetical protein [Candidatus Krumholzibacteriota bacterium]
MAKLEKKNINPFLAAIANFCCLGFLGYFLIGQSKKAILFLIVAVVLLLLGTIGMQTLFLPFITSVLYLALVILAAIDIHALATGVEKDEEVDEHEYKSEILYKLMSPIHKEAVFKKGGPQKKEEEQAEAEERDENKE